MIATNKEMFLVAMSQYGIAEWTGIEHNPEVMKYFHDIGHERVKDDETAWCAAFMNWCAKVSGYIGTGQLTAKSFLKVGTEVLIGPTQGDVVILHNGDIESWQGHVGLFVYKDDHFVWVLGGNQGNQINIARYPLSRVLEYRTLDRMPTTNA